MMGVTLTVMRLDDELEGLPRAPVPLGRPHRVKG